MLIHTRKGTTIVTQQEKVTYKTRQEMNNLFQRLCSVRSFSTSFPGFSPTRPTERTRRAGRREPWERGWILLLSRKHLQLFATGSFHFEPSQLLLDKFAKSSTLPWKNRQQTASWSVFLKLLSRYNRLSKTSFVRCLYGAGPVANLSLAWPPRGVKSSLRLLRNSWNSISRQFQWVFRSFVTF